MSAPVLLRWYPLDCSSLYSIRWRDDAGRVRYSYVGLDADYSYEGDRYVGGVTLTTYRGAPAPDEFGAELAKEISLWECGYETQHDGVIRRAA